MATTTKRRPAGARTKRAHKANVAVSVSDARVKFEELDECDKRWIQELGRRWAAHHKVDLELRHETGLIVNTRIGPPTERQAYGSQVLKMVAHETRVNESDLSRMRWFSHRFRTYVSFLNAHPYKTSWEQVKLLLVELATEEKKKDPSTEKDQKDNATPGVLRAIKSATSKLNEGDPIRDKNSRIDCLAELQKFAIAVRKSLGVKITLDEASEEATA